MPWVDSNLIGQPMSSPDLFVIEIGDSPREHDNGKGKEPNFYPCIHDFDPFLEIFFLVLMVSYCSHLVNRIDRWYLPSSDISLSDPL